MAECYQSGTGVRYGGQAGLAEKAHVASLEQLPQSLQLQSRSMLVEQM